MFNYLIILTAVINLINSQEPPEVDDVAVLSGLASSTLDCSLKFDRDFIASNSDIAAAIEEMLENRPTRQARATREPCEEGEDCRPRRGRGGKKRRDTTTVDPESETVPEFRRALRGAGKGRGRRDVTREPLADGETREPCTGDDCRGRGKGRRRDVTREPRDKTREPRDVTREPLADGETREPCTGDNCRGRGKGRRRRDDDSSESRDDEATTAAPLLRRALREGKGRGVTREPLADGETREPRSTREPCTDDDCEGKGRGRGDESRERTTQPCEDGEDCRRGRPRRDDSERRHRDDDSESSDDEEATTAARALGGEREGRGISREPLADGETRVMPDCEVYKRPETCFGKFHGEEEQCYWSYETRECIGEPVDPEPREDDGATSWSSSLQRLLRRGERNAELVDGATRDRSKTREQGDRKQRRRRKVDATEEPTTEPLLRRSLGRQGRRRRRGIEATISDGSVEVAGLVGEVVFGEVDEDLESVPLSLTLGGVTFSCDVEVRRRGVSCRAVSEEDFKVRIGCAIETPEL